MSPSSPSSRSQPVATAAAPSRRAFLAGGLAAAAATAAGTSLLAERLLTRTRRPGGELLPQLLTGDPFYIAHGGGSADWPDMSMAAYRQAVEHGVNALEISLARSADGVWFGLHDPTLDRMSGTSHFVASQHDWSQISRYDITGAGTRDPRQPHQPYLRFEELVAAYASTHTIFVDPKATPALHYRELFTLMERAGPRPTDSFIAKAYCTTTRWAAAARERGYHTWGYYYGRAVRDGATPLAATQGFWDLLGMDVDAAPAEWAAVTAYGKPVIAHIIATRAQARRARRAGARGLMVSGVREVLGGR